MAAALAWLGFAWAVHDVYPQRAGPVNH